MYSFVAAKKYDELEPLIEGMRRLRRAEELKRSEDRITQKRLRVRQNNMAVQGGSKRPEVLSYDMHGKSVDVKSFASLPNLVPECVKADLAARDQDATAKMVRRKSTKKTAMPRNEGFDLQGLLNGGMQSLPQKEEEGEESLHDSRTTVVAGVYEALVPNTGVTFLEEGKDPKKNAATVAEKRGLMNKADFYSSLATGGGSVLLPIIPNIKKEDTSSTQPPARKALSTLDPTMSAKLSTRRNSSGPEVSQLLVAFHTQAPQQDYVSPSSLPKLYVPPSFRRGIQRNSSLPGLTRITDDKNVDVGAEAETGRGRLDPIVLGERASARLMRESLGTMHDFTRG